MPSKAPKPCGRCGQKATHSGLCETHFRQTERRRGTSNQRGYGRQHRDTFRQAVLDRDHWTCQLCGAPADVADHHPLTRRQLVTQGLDPDRPCHGRALCASCHGAHTASTTPGFGADRY